MLHKVLNKDFADIMRTLEKNSLSLTMREIGNVVNISTGIQPSRELTY